VSHENVRFGHKSDQRITLPVWIIRLDLWSARAANSSQLVTFAAVAHHPMDKSGHVHDSLFPYQSGWIFHLETRRNKLKPIISTLEEPVFFAGRARTALQDQVNA